MRMQQQIFLQLLAGQLLLLLSTAYANTLYFQSKTDLICPDNIHSCNNETTCCLLPDGQYGCCMYANAVCCSDNIHCCPTGSYCDVNTGSCNKDGTSIKWSKKIQAALYIPKPKMNNKESLVEKISSTFNIHFQQPESIPWAKKLPGLKLNSLNMSSLNLPASCSVSQTLCKSSNGLSGCCPFPNAVCCSEGQQCCPSGFQCNLKSSKCEKLTEEPTKELISLQPTHSLFALRDPVVCPDAVTVCRTGSTCCPLGKDGYACCPYPSASCCSDRRHCCPNGYSCDVSANRCVKKHVDMIMVKMSKWHAGQTCPDMETTCPEGTTCCPLEGGTYGCCPYPNAVCCSDNYHCCPRGYTCDVKASKCQILSQALLTCPDHQTQCSSGMTCCLIKEHVYGCCPFPQATCCLDQQHCCPQGFVCNANDNQCERPPQTKSTSNQNIVCPDQSTECASWQTCCALSDGAYGCCPYPEATCCTDHKHCCPNGYDCDIAHHKCIRKSIGLMEISARLLSIQSPVPNLCPDNSYCPVGTTCCANQQNYNCCPLPEAKCCADGKHCCPKNFICDSIRGRCRIEVPIKRVALTSLSVSKVTFSCPDSQCPSGSTCCPISSTHFACCPLPKAVCCHDNTHCCPKNYHCDLEHKRCVMGQTSLPLLKKFLPSNSLTKVEKVAQKVSKVVMCPDQSECPDKNTCCLMDTGAWGCCPYEQAVCCIDRKHCCPKSYFCDMTQSKCALANTSINKVLSLFYSNAKPLKKLIP